MKYKPFSVSFSRSVCGRKAPLIIGVFLLISLLISQPVLAFEQINSVSIDTESSTFSTIDKIESYKNEEEVENIVDSTEILPDSKVDPIVSDINHERYPLPLTINTESETPPIEEEELADGQVPSQVPTSPLNTTGVDPKSQTLGKYISPDVSVVDGSLNYSYPIVVPPGRAGLNPDLKLFYDSNNTSQNSIVGIGWAFNIPYIQRVNKKGTGNIYAQDNFISSLDGELVGQGNGSFIPRIENGNFLKYTYNDKSWTVINKNGTQYIFGLSQNSRQDDQSGSKVFTWMLEKILDTNGNTISYTYFKDQGQIYPDTISYNQTGIFTIEFSRSPRIHANTSYGTAFKVVTRFRISSIQTKVNGTLANKYTIGFLSEDDNLVKSITVGDKSFNLPPVKFENFSDKGSKTWDYDSSFALPIDPTTGKVLVLDYNNSIWSGNSFMDINGDGLLDIVRWTSGKVNGYASLASGNQIFLNTGTEFKLKNDFLLPTDSKQKVLVLDYTSCRQFCNPVASNFYGNSFIDINGDGLPDIVRWAADQTNGYQSSDSRKGNQVFLNTGSGFILDPDFLLPTDQATGKVLALDYANNDQDGSSFMDINGDGLPDIVRWDRNQTNGQSTILKGNQVFINTGSGFILDSNYTNALPTGPNGKVLTLNFTSCRLPLICSYAASNLYGNSFIDINGDGLPDIVRWTQGKINGYYNTNVNNNGNQVFLNTGSGFILDPDFLLPTASDGKVLVLDYNFGNDSTNTFYGNSFIDINGDGLPDVVRWLANQQNGYSNPNYTSGNQVFLNTGSGFILDPDFLLPEENQKVFSIGFNYNNYYGNSFIDINGDGLPDIVRWNKNEQNGYSSSSSGNQVFLNTGSGFILDPDFLLPTASDGKVLVLDYTACKPPQTCSSVPTNLYGNSFKDINSDGILDIVRWSNTQINEPPTNSLSGNQVFLGAVGRKAIKKIISSSGGEETFSFKAIREFTNSNNIGLNGRIPSGYKPFVVDSHTMDDKNGNIGITNYKYHEAYYFNPYNDPFNKKIAGFGEVIKINQNGTITNTKYHQGNGQNGDEPIDSYTKIGKVYEVTVKNESGDLYSRTRINYIEKNLGNDAKSIQVSSRLIQTFDGDSTHKDIALAYRYDMYGNLIEKISFGEVLGSSNGTYSDIGSDKFTENTFYARDISGNYVVGFPYENILLDQIGNKVNQTKKYYDNLGIGLVDTGNQTKIENWKSGTSYVNTQIVYDSFGLPIKLIDERNKITNYIYDSYNLYPIVIRDPLGNRTKLSYEYATGKLNSKIDQNGFVYQFTFDGFGRVLEEKIPDLIPPYVPVLKTRYIYTDIPLESSIKTMNYLDDANSIDSYQYFDGFGRLIQERTEAEGVNNFKVKDIIYNNIGLIQKETLNYFSMGVTKTVPMKLDALYVVYQYDSIDRMIKAINSIGSTSTIYDDWKTVSIDANNKIKNYYKDAYGNLIKIEELNNGSIYTTIYEWNGNKNLVKIIDALNNVRKFTYDGLGRRLTAEDLHRTDAVLGTFGVWTYVYDDAGNLIQTTNPENKIRNYTYDDLNRVFLEYTTDINMPEILYAYDGATLSCPNANLNANGKLCAVFTMNGTNSNYKYNSNGAISEKNQYIGTTTSYKTSYTYDRLGNILTITYPDSSVIRYSYNNGGYLEKIEKSEDGNVFSDIVSSFDYSPMGQVTRQVNNNSTTTLKVYDATKLYRLSFLTTKNNITQNKLQDLSYIYDSVGNIISLTDSSNTETSKTVNYTYDDLNRLISATTVSVASGRAPYTQTFAYDAIGNILSGGAGTYTYENLEHVNPHAVTKIVSPNYIQNFTYDKNGNLVNKTTTGLTAVLDASVNPNGLATQAGIVGPQAPGVASIGSGSSAVPLGPINLSNLAPNSTYPYKVQGSNQGSGYVEGGSVGENSIVISTASGPKPAIVAYAIGNVGKHSATIMAEINPNGRSTDAWFLFQGDKKAYTHLPDNNDLYSMSHTLTGLNDGTTYQVKVVAKNDKGTTDSGYISFTTLPEPPPPPPPPAIPPPPTVYKYPYITSVNVKMNVPTYQLDNDIYTWNDKNQLIEVSNSTSKNSYLYDYTGSRLKSSVYQNNLNETYITYTPSKFYEIAKSPSVDDVVTKYIYAGDTLVGTIKKVGTTLSETTYVYSDNLGGTGVTAKSDGNLLSALDYYPFGAQRVCAGECDMAKKYIGQSFDVDTSLNYLNARYYDSTIGRFISQDPMFWSPEKILMDPQSMNSYSYARNNPMLLVDDSGEFWHIVAGAAIGALIAGGVTYWQTGDLKQAGNAAIGGAITGALIAAVGPAAVASLPAAMAIGAGANTVGSSATRLLNGEQITAGTILTDGAVGAVGGGLGYGAGKAVTATMSKIKVGNVPKTTNGVFPKNPDELMPELPRDAKGRIYPNENIRIRTENHGPIENGGIIPRHSELHYHVDYRPDPTRGWSNRATQTITPPGWTQGMPKGFLPGEEFPGVTIRK